VVVELGDAGYVDAVAPEIGLVEQPDEVYHWYEYGGTPPAGLELRVIVWPLSIVGEEGVMAPAERAVVGAKLAVIVPVPPIVAVVDAELGEAIVIDPLLELHEVNDQ